MKRCLYAINVFSVILITLVAAGCGSPLAPFDPTVINQSKDETAPVIRITSPDADTDYGQIVTVTGTVSDDGSLMPEIKYEVTDVLGSQVKVGEVVVVPVETDAGVAGTFTFDFSTAEYNTDILIALIGTDWNENEGVPVTMRLNYSGSGIPSFKTVPSNGTIALSWDAVVGADNYRLYYTTDGNLPSAQYGTELSELNSTYAESDPLLINGLENGEVHTFLLTASSNAGRLWCSEYKLAVPLSARSLKPNITRMYGSIRLDWQTMRTDMQYQVFRAKGSPENFVNISGNISDTVFIDSSVDEVIEYYYRVRPAIEGGGFSETVTATSFKYPYSAYRPMSVTPTAGANSDIDIYGVYAFLAQGANGLQRVNISNKNQPTTIVPTTWGGCSVKAVCVEDYYAYIADSNYGLRIYSYNKADSGLKGGCPTSHSSGRINDVVYSGSAGAYAYAAWPLDMGAGHGGVDKIRVSNKDFPSVEDNYTRTDADYYKLSVSDDGAYIYAVYIDPLTPYFGMDIIRTSDMAKVYPSFGHGLPALDVSLQDDYAYVVDGTSLVIYDVSTPSSPSAIGECMLYGESREIDVEGDFAYVTEENNGLRIVNIADPSAPVIADFYSEEAVSGITVSGSYAYIAAGGSEPSDNRLSVLNAGGIFNYSQKSLHSVTDSADVVCMHDNYVLCADYDGDLTVIDIEDSANPVDICTFTPLGTIREIQVSGEFLYLSINEFAGTKALQVVDFSAPSAGWSPDSWSFELDDNVGGFAVKGDYLYLADDDSGFAVIDISDPTAAGWPVYSSVIDTAGDISDCVIDGDNLYLLSSWLGIQIFDISDPKSPEFKGAYSTTGDALGIDVIGDYVCIADGYEGLKVVDVSSPKVSGWTPDVYQWDLESTDLSAASVETEGDFAYLSYYDRQSPYDKSPGVAVIGIANPESPHLIGIHETQGSNDNRFWTNGETLLIAADSDGLEVVEIDYK